MCMLLPQMFNKLKKNAVFEDQTLLVYTHFLAFFDKKKRLYVIVKNFIHELMYK